MEQLIEVADEETVEIGGVAEDAAEIAVDADDVSPAQGKVVGRLGHAFDEAVARRERGGGRLDGKRDVVAAPGQDRIGARIDVEDEAERAQVALPFAHGERDRRDLPVGRGLRALAGQVGANRLEACFAGQKERARECPARTERATQAAQVGGDEVRRIGAAAIALGAKELAAARSGETGLQGQPARKERGRPGDVHGPGGTGLGMGNLRAGGADETAAQ